MTTLATDTFEPGVRIARLEGPPPLCFFLLHGYPDTLQIFGPLARALSRAGQVVALDWPARPGAASPVERAELVRRAARALAPDRRIVLVGHDMGALPALCLAGGGDAAAVVAMNALLVPDAPTSPEIRLLRAARSYRLALRAAWPAVLARCLATFTPTALPRDVEADLRAAFARREARLALIAACERYDDALPSWRAIAAGARAPVLFLWGERERHFPADHARRFAAACARATVEVVPGGHHWMAWHAAPIVAARILDWLAREEANREGAKNAK